MRHLYRLLIALPVALLVVLFAVSNRQFVALQLWPLPGAVELPVFLLGLAMLAVGFLLGGAVIWVGAMRTRRRLSRAVRVIADQEREIATLRVRNGPSHAPVAGAPALTGSQPPAPPAPRQAGAAGR